MSVASPVSALPSVRLEVSQGGRSVPYRFDQVDFLIGAVAGCDLRVPGADLPAVLCLIARHPDGLSLRRLAPTQVLLLNGAAVSRAELTDGDRLTVGAVDIVVRVETPVQAQPLGADFDLEKEVADLEEQRACFEREKNEFRNAQAQAVQPTERVAIGADLLQRELTVAQGAEELTKREQALDARSAEIEKQKQEIAAVRQELSDIRQQLHERYQERRDRLSGLQEAVDRAARKVQDAKRELQQNQLDFSRQAADVARREAEVEALRTQLDAERRAWDESQGEIQTDLAAKVADLSGREDRLASQKQTLEARERQYQSDLLRLDRRQGEIEERERQLAEQAALLKDATERLHVDSAELEIQAQELDAFRTRTQAEADELAAQKTAHDARQKSLDQRTALLEGQQTSLMTLRGKLERMRDEFRQHDQALEAQRLAQDEIAQQNAAKHDELRRLEADLRSRADGLALDQQQVIERQATLANAVANLNDAQERIALQEQTVALQSQALEKRGHELADQEALLKGRMDQLADSQVRLDLERQALRERTVALAQTEQAREALQEQLRRRSEDLAQKQKQLLEQLEQVRAKEVDVELREADIASSFETTRVALEAEKRVLDEQANQLALRREEIVQLDGMHRQHLEELQSRSQALAEQERQLSEQQTKNQNLWRDEQTRLRKDRDDIETLRRQAQALLLELPDLELRAGTAVDRLSHAREQLRDHLGEVHAFIRQTQDDFAAAHARLRHEEAEFARKDADFRRLHDDHRLALVAFRQQMIDWQAQIKDVQRLIKKEDKGVENRQARVDDQEKQLDSTARELAVENVLLGVQKQTVSEQKNDLDRHVGDLRDWYRRKMRELAGGGAEAEIVDATAALIDGDETPLVPTDRDILSITGPVDPSDQTLATTLTEHQLVDANAVHALLVEALRQRRPLKQVLVAAGAVTPYQLALIEAGKLDGLAIGPFRVVDRIRQTPYETIYRVFDPRRGQEALLRHLSEDAALDAVLPDEYRQRFTRLILPDAHVAGVLETLDLDNRPAIVQEWLTGLPANDWPPLAAAPGVCYRLLTQAALGLSALHKQSLVHGRLSEQNLILTPQGILKLRGANEPGWLTGAAEVAATVADDLLALGRIVSGWCTPTGVRKGSKTKPLPEKMLAILRRLQSTADDAYPNVRALLDDLDQASADVPANPEAWDRLIRHVRDHAQPEAILRQSA
jgi:hypothetical protein